MYVDGQLVDRHLPGDAAPGAAGLDVAILHDRGPRRRCSAVDRRRALEFAPAPPLEELTAPATATAAPCSTLRPPTLDLLTDVADRGEVMPPKTTYFDPKPYAGIFLRG